MVGRGTLTPLELKLRTDISDNLNKLKQEKGYNQQDIVKGSGISQSTLSQYFAGKRLPSKKKQKYLLISLKFLLKLLTQGYRILLHPPLPPSNPSTTN